ncbi:MAG: HAD hydrolase-like protein, partial [Christensenellales bacterium]
MDKNAAFKNLLFDLDGTLTDPALGITSAAQYALGKMGIEVADRTTLTWLIGPPLIGSFEEGFGMTNLQALEALKHYRAYFSEKGIFENEIYPGIAELLSDLKAAGRRVMVATSKPEEFTHRILEHFDIARYFDFVGGNT